MSETPAITAESSELGTISQDLATAAEIIRELTVPSRVNPWIHEFAAELPRGTLVLAYTAPPEEVEHDRPSEYIIRQLSNTRKPGSRLFEEVEAYRWSSLNPTDRNQQLVTKSDPKNPGRPVNYSGFTDNDAKSIKKLVAKAKKFNSRLEAADG